MLPSNKSILMATSTMWQSWAFIGLVCPDSSIMRSGTPLLRSLYYSQCRQARTVLRSRSQDRDAGSSQLIVSGTLDFNFQLKSLQTRHTCYRTVYYRTIKQSPDQALACQWHHAQRFPFPSPKMKRSKYK